MTKRRVTAVLLGLTIAGISAFVALSDRSQASQAHTSIHQTPTAPAGFPARPRTPQVAPAGATDDVTTHGGDETQTVDVRVELADGQAAARSLISFAPTAKFRPDAYAGSPATVTTDDAGRVVLVLGDRGATYEVSAVSEDGSFSTRKPARVVPGDTVSLRLSACSTVTGRVTGFEVEETPYLLAYCPAWPEHPGQRRIPVARDGSFRVTGVFEFITLTAHSDGRSPSDYLRVDSLSAAENVELRLGVRGEARELRLVADSGEALGAGIAVQYQAGSTGWTRTVSDSDGRVRVIAPQSSSVRVSVPAVRALPDGCWKYARTDVDVPPGSAVVTVATAVRTSFKVVDPSGAPLRGLRVSVRPAGPGSHEVVAQTSGGASVDGSGIVRPFATVAYRAGTYSLQTEDGVVIWQGDCDGAESEIPVVVRGIRCIRVRLVDASGAPIFASSATCRVAEDLDSNGSVAADEGPALFRDASEVVLSMRNTAFTRPVIRVACRGVGAATVPIPVGDRVDVRLPAGGASVRVVVPAGARHREVTLYLRADPTAATDRVFYAPCPAGETAALFYGLPPGIWHADVQLSGLELAPECRSPVELIRDGEVTMTMVRPDHR